MTLAFGDDPMTLMKMPRILLQSEGLALFVTAVLFYAHVRGNGLLFALLLFVPDAAMIGYIANPRLGSITYNVVHTLTAPTLFGLVALAAGWQLGVWLALIWLAHIGMDRALGYGLKYPTAFRDTHFQRA
jgi:hypothetical protein